MNQGDSYKRAGVDIEAATESLGLIKSHVRSTFTSGVISDLGLFSGLFTIPEIKEYQELQILGMNQIKKVSEL